MSLDSRSRKDLLARSHPLRPTVTLSTNLTDAAVAQVRTAFGSRELLKVRVQADSTAECDEVAARLAREVPCELVKRVGHVVILFRPADKSDR